MAVKCNISTYISELLDKLNWGFNCKHSNNDILRNYINYLQCPDVAVEECVIDTCTNEAIVGICNLRVRRLTSVEGTEDDDFDLEVSIDTDDITGGVAPYTYNWAYDTTEFSIVGSNTLPTLKLNLLEGKELDLLVVAFSVVLVDSNGCSTTKLCYLTPQGMQCGSAYVACTNVLNLVVVASTALPEGIQNLAVVAN